MHIITRTTLREFWEKHPDAEEALSLWYTRSKHAKWRKLLDVQHNYRTAESVGRFTVFNIMRNRYRLIVRIEYERQIIYIRHVLTHKEYDRDKWKKDDWF